MPRLFLLEQIYLLVDFHQWSTDSCMYSLQEFSFLQDGHNSWGLVLTEKNHW